MSFRINQDILRLHVPICNSLDVVEEFQYQDNLCGIESSGVDVESSCIPQISEDLPSRAVVKLHQSVTSRCTIRLLLGIADQHVKTLSIGEGCDQGCNEWMPSNCGERIPFIANVFDLLQPDDCRR